MLKLVSLSTILAKDQGGCRFLQQKVQEKDPEIILTIFNNAIENFISLMMDPFGNYLTQKLVEGASDRQLT